MMPHIIFLSEVALRRFNRSGCPDIGGGGEPQQRGLPFVLFLLPPTWKE
jgi:hypothetical protein